MLPLTTLGDYQMRPFVRKPFARTRRAGSHFALAVALAVGGAIVTGGLAVPAFAKEKKKEEKAPKPEYTKEFVVAFQGIDAQLKAEAPDLPAIKAQIPGVVALAQTDDDKNVAGSLLLRYGQAAHDQKFQKDGLVLMLESGKVAPEEQGRYSTFVSQLAFQEDNYAQAKEYASKALALGYTDGNGEIILAESAFAQGQPQQGIAYINQLVDRTLAAGKLPEEGWLKRGLAISYKENLASDAGKFGLLFAKYYPSKQSWGDAIAVLRNYNKFEAPEALDLLRLVKRSDTFRTRLDYAEYVEVADPRKLPGEVVDVLDNGYASGIIKRDDAFIKDVYTQAQTRAAADRADMVGIEADARKPGATLAAVASTGDVFLSYNQPAKAEEFYTKALQMPGADVDALTMRLAIAQFDQGKFAESKANFAKVTGKRKSIAELWSVYVDQKSGA